MKFLPVFEVLENLLLFNVLLLFGRLLYTVLNMFKLS